MRIYKVNEKFGDCKEQFSNDFKTASEAKEYATDLATKNAAMKIKVVYNIYEFDELIDSVDSTKLTAPASPRDLLEGGGAGGKSSGATFKPTPFAVAPRPKGMPQNWLIDPDEDDKTKK